LVARLEGIGLVRDDAGMAVGQRGGAREGPLKQARAVAQPHERLGKGLARDRPETGAGAAGQYDRYHREQFSSNWGGSERSRRRAPGAMPFPLRSNPSTVPLVAPSGHLPCMRWRSPAKPIRFDSARWTALRRTPNQPAK